MSIYVTWLLIGLAVGLLVGGTAAALSSLLRENGDHRR